jgi:hypothetical protein
VAWPHATLASSKKANKGPAAMSVHEVRRDRADILRRAKGNECIPVMASPVHLLN